MQFTVQSYIVYLGIEYKLQAATPHISTENFAGRLFKFAPLYILFSICMQHKQSKILSNVDCAPQFGTFKALFQ
jgi:hypothetical protein